MTKYLSLAALGIATTNARWYYPEEVEMAFNDMDSWTWMPLPTEADFPFQEEAEWFMQAEFANNSAQDCVRGWYVTEGVWAVQTEHSYASNTISSTEVHQREYWVNANDLHALVQTNFEIMMMSYFNFYAEAAVADENLMKLTVYTPGQINYFWDDSNNDDVLFGFGIGASTSLWTTVVGFTSNLKSCTGDFFELIDGAEFKELLVCKYESDTLTTHAVTGASTPSTVEWSYERTWTF